MADLHLAPQHSFLGRRERGAQADAPELKRKHPADELVEATDGVSELPQKELRTLSKPTLSARHLFPVEATRWTDHTPSSAASTPTHEASRLAFQQQMQDLQRSLSSRQQLEPGSSTVVATADARQLQANAPPGGLAPHPGAGPGSTEPPHPTLARTDLAAAGSRYPPPSFGPPRLLAHPAHPGLAAHGLMPQAAIPSLDVDRVAALFLPRTDAQEGMAAGCEGPHTYSARLPQAFGDGQSQPSVQTLGPPVAYAAGLVVLDQAQLQRLQHMSGLMQLKQTAAFQEPLQRLRAGCAAPGPTGGLPRSSSAAMGPPPSAPVDSPLVAPGAHAAGIAVAPRPVGEAVPLPLPLPERLAALYAAASANLEQDPSALVFGQVRETADKWLNPLEVSPSPEEVVAAAKRVAAGAEDDCSVCLDRFSEGQACLQLHRCHAGHYFHEECITAALRTNMRCPNCTTQYGMPTGLQPAGRMAVTLRPFQLPGEEDSFGTYVLAYQFPNGLQGPRHPNPGVEYTGTSRRAYIPATEHGQHILRKFMKAWDARVLFTVGTSLTTGRPNCVVWNGIHHKTSITGGPVHFGFPDPDYLASVESELDSAGIH